MRSGGLSLSSKKKLTDTGSGSNTPSALDHAVALTQSVCRLAGPASFVRDCQAEFKKLGLSAAVERHDTATLFDWLISVLSFQGIANRIADQYIEDHGNATFAAVEQSLAADPACAKLEGYWTFNGCRYLKSAATCSEQQLMADCPVPVHTLRNGRLNQTAYSLFLFIRDVANGDLVQWIDDQLATCRQLPPGERAAASRASLVVPLREIYGVSDKVVCMAIAALLIGVGARRKAWFQVGTTFIVVDTLVHNFLHRSGILRRFHAEHGYGADCYAPNGCADLISEIAGHIDARAFNPQFPSHFPRFLQLAIWRYCGEGELNVCNGNQITDTARCDNSYCRVSSHCDRVILHKMAKNDDMSVI